MSNDDKLIEEMAKEIMVTSGAPFGAWFALDAYQRDYWRGQAHAALAVVRRNEGWQPIETAPKAWEPIGDDGCAMSRRILLGNDHGSLFIGYWSDPAGGPGCWKDTSTNQPVFSKPTRWRPVPA